MTDFLENEAEVSSGDDEEYSAKERKKIKHMKHVPSDSSEEEEDDEDRIREENKGFINDDDDDEGSGSGSGSGSDSDQDDRKPKRRREDDDDDLDADNLDEDDLDLIEENIGVKIDRKKKFKRLKRVVDEDSDDADDGDGRDQIANELFHGSDDEDRRSTSPAPRDTGATAHEDIGSGGEYEESDEEDFIVDDQGKPIQKSKKKAIFEDEGLEAARDIFGCDFDYGDFEQYDAEGVVDSDEADDEEDEYEEDEDDDDEEAAAIRKEALKRKKEKKKRTLKKTIYDVFEPAELERGHLTDKDAIIRQEDVPERFQLRQIPVTPTREDPEDHSKDPILLAEADWIYQNAFSKPSISRQDTTDDLCDTRRDDRDRSYRYNRDCNRENITAKIYNALDLMRNHKLEVPFIAFYRKEEVQPELKIHHLWTIYQYDAKFCQLEQRKKNLQELLKNYHNFQMETVMSRPLDAPLPEGTRILQTEEIERVSEIESTEQIGDCSKHFMLHYGSQREMMHEYRRRKIKEQRQASRKTVTRTVKVMRKVKRKKRKKKRAIIDDDEDVEMQASPSRRSRSRSKSGSRSRSKSRSKSRSRSKSGSRSRSRSKSGSRSRSRSKSGSRSRSRSKSKAKSRSNSRSRSRSKSGSRSRSRSRSNSRSHSGSRPHSAASNRSGSRGGSPASRGSQSPKSKGRQSPASGGASPASKKDESPVSKVSRSPVAGRRESHDSSSENLAPTSAATAAPPPDNDDDIDNRSEGYQSGGEEGGAERTTTPAPPAGQEPPAAASLEAGVNALAVTSDDETRQKADSDSEEEVETEVETEIEEEVEDEDEEEKKDEESESLKKAIRRHEYELLKKAGIEPLTKQFGLTPEQFGENLRDDYQRYEVDQCHVEPLKEAEAYLSKMCTSPTHVLEGAVRMLGWQLACEPLVRKTVREVYFERARLDVRPTQKGLKLIDEQHPLYALKYIKNKPVHDLHNEQFLKLKTAVDDKLIEIQFCENIEGNKSSSYLDEMKQLYYKDEFSRVVQDWNDLRGRAVEFAYKKIIEDLKRELTERLLSESRNHVLERCCAKLHHWIKVAPYAAGDFADEDEDDWDTSKGFRVLALAYDPDPSQAAFAAVVDVDGDIIEYKRYPNMLKRKDAYDERFAAMKEDDLQKFRDLIMRRRPHVITIGGESKEALMLVEDIKEVVSSLEEQEQFPKINVELLDNTLAILYALSKKGEADFPDFPPLLRQAVSLARRMQDPLLEFSQLCNPDDEILNLRYHPLQDLLNPIELLNHLSIEFVNRTNEVGVDLNLAVAYPYRQNLVQFLCGFGPRKANQLIKQIKQNDHRLENRNQLVLTFHMGPKVYVNIAGFIKIDTAAVGSSDTYIEVLDSTRIHPEAYDWARKMAVDALDCDDEDLNKPAEALEEILDCPEKLSELDLEAFAKELENQGFGLKNTTLYDIRHELNHRYKDFRAPYESPTAEEIFNMLTKESPETLYVGKLVQCTVIRFIHRKPRGDQLDNANPVRNEDSGLWKCPFCMKSDFPELSDVWNHFDAGDCPGQAIGIKVKIDNNIMGFINIKNLSDKPVNNPAERVKKFGLIHARITKIDPERFSVDLTSRTSDLQDKDGTWKPPKDHYYDAEAEEKDMIQNQKKRDKKSRTYHKRVIAHPSFHNIDYKEVDKLLSAMDQGEAIIRPSSKGIDHLTVSWKVTEGVFQHIDVIEQDKQNHFSLGRRLWIGTLEFEDLDEILARYVSPVASNVRQILEYKYYKESVAGSKEKAAEYLKRDKEKNPKAIPYIFSPVKTLPGKFLLSYLPRTKVIHEHVTVLHDGFKFREKHLFPSLASLLKWFKMNFRNITSSGIGAATPGRMSSRTPYMGGTTPSMVGLDTPSMHKSHMLHNISTVASATPYSIATPNSNYSQTPYSNYAQTPYTPSGQTPFMTPYATTPGPSTTPRYGGVTPNPNLASQLLPPPQRSHIAAHYGSATNGAGVTPMPGYGSGAPGYHGSGAPIASHMSHRPPSSRASASMHSRSEQQDWSKAAEAWAKASRSDGRTTPRYSSTDTRRGSGGRSEGGGRTPRYSEGGSRYQPYSQPDYDASRSTPRSVRSTPKTIHSPTNMSIGGDQTPLYDE